MRIENTNPMDPFSAAELVKALATRSGGAKASNTPAPADAGQTQALIQQALAASDVRVPAVEDARRLMETDQLESAPALNRLAERLHDLGI